MLAKGATVTELTEALGWQPHTLCAAISRLPVKPERSYRLEAW
jgi:hypothetical protein